MAAFASTLSRLRTLWWAIHRWIALVLCILLVPSAPRLAPEVMQAAE